MKNIIQQTQQRKGTSNRILYNPGLLILILLQIIFTININGKNKGL